MKKKRILIIFAIIFFAMFIYSSSQFVIGLLTDKKENQNLKELSLEIHEIRKEDEKISEDGLIIKNINKLHETNNDLVGWIQIDSLNIDYPIMFTPEDPEYYLRRDFERNYSFRGSLFVGEDTSLDSNYAIVFGHGMNDGSMFGGLSKYADQNFYNNNKTFEVYTLEEKRIYEIMGAFYSKYYDSKKEQGFRYYYYTDLSNPKTFEEFKDYLQMENVLDIKNEIEYGDRILVLSTCAYHVEDGRFAVIAKEIK